MGFICFVGEFVFAKSSLYMQYLMCARGCRAYIYLPTDVRVFYPDFARYPQLYQNHYGHLNGTLEAVLDVSQDLAQELQPFRAGVGIVLPELVVPSDEGVMLWG